MPGKYALLGLLILSAATAQNIKTNFDLQDGHDSASFQFRLNEASPMTFSIRTKEKKHTRITVKPQPQEFKLPGWYKKKGKEPEPFTLDNQILTFSFPGTTLPYYIRPKFNRYKPAEISQYLPKWTDLPDALNKFINVEIRGVNGIMRLYVDGRFMAQFPGSLAGIDFSLPPKAELLELKSFPYTSDSVRYEVLDIAQAASSGFFNKGTLSIPKGLQQFDGVPMILQDCENSQDVSLLKPTRGLEVLEVDLNLSRDAFERLPESFLLSVPQASYNQAFILFALDPDPKKERAMTLRMTRLAPSAGRGTPLAHTDLTFPAPGEPLPPNIKQVGNITMDDKVFPLFLGTFPLDLGEYLDILEEDIMAHRRNKSHPYLDFEIFGSRGSFGAYMSGHLKPSGRPSAVNVFGVTLGKSPVSIKITQSQPGNLIAEDEAAEMKATLTANIDGDYELDMRICDWRNKSFRADIFDWPQKQDLPLRSEKHKVKLKAGESKDITLSLAMPDLGYYVTRLIVSDLSTGKQLFHHRGAFALIAQNDRRASSKECQFSAWWWCGAHGTDRDYVKGLSILEKIGFKKNCYAALGFVRKKILDKPEVKQFDFTITQIPWVNIKDPDDKEKSWEEIAKVVEPIIAAYPNTKEAMIFHESYGDPTPPELLGLPKTYKDQDEKDRDLLFMKKATVAAQYYREKHPDIKLVYGNHNSSSGLIAALLRNGFDTKYLDFAGLETPGQGCMPERLWQGGVQGCWFVKETARILGYELPLTCSYEFTARPMRILGMETLAKYKVRDALLGFAYGFNMASISGLDAVRNGYLQTIWGGGACMRTPFMYPYPQIVAMSVLSKAIDQATFIRKMDTGSPTIYAHEYSRKRGDFVYACWLPRGEATIDFSFPKGTTAEILTMYGRSTKLTAKDGHIAINASSEPSYVISPVKAEGTNAIRKPDPPSNTTVADTLNSIDGWKLIANCSDLQDWDIYRKPGDFTFNQVNDNEKGQCLELKLNKNGEIPPIYGEYTKIEKTVNLPGTPGRIGIWAKGDSGWGKIGFILQDARGFQFRSEGNWNDFGCELYLNFDGWKYISFPIAAVGKNHGIRPSLGQDWNPVTKGHLPMEYPLKLVGIYVTLFRMALDPTEMKPVPAAVRLANLSVSQ